ncbi:hypothetical protein [Motilimonas pumila]|uniref:Lipoprotein n=1 Tax=Motilimonas pumila TaxID=2303987 RepID=A0A418YC61_9GAMM|nr:hypothetical protein [Motilimonas pumila]RJG42101.1 hypothetical protein D1Z90_15055 [Motilimonas pumila]
MMRLFSCSIVLLMASGCGGGSSGNVGQSLEQISSDLDQQVSDLITDSSDKVIDAIDETVATVTDINKLKGVWLQDCAHLYQVASQDYQYQTSRIEYDGVSHGHIEFTFYSDSECNAQTRSISYPVSLHIGEQRYSSQSFVATEFDLKCTQVENEQVCSDEFNLLYLESERLFLGEKTMQQDASSASTRPMTLNLDAPYQLQATP